ncbi:hypothetical protein GcM1_246192 [Golovinomyces cichoracearum]|uniref:Uncharacterized protein n=1 Tax=Golovinomyces cichoracearum TaxID=62708 RepID=A0A420IEQ7_9PEZI|nr:hypothetical protein GcM1_246192 [Golovinomyces cichoracearum]
MKRSTSPTEDNNLTPFITQSCSTEIEAPPPLEHKERFHRFKNLQTSTPVDPNIPRPIHRITFSPVNAQFLPATPSVCDPQCISRVNSRGEYSTATSSMFQISQQMERFTSTPTERIEGAKEASDSTVMTFFHELVNKGHFGEKLYDASLSYPISTKVREFLQRFWRRFLDWDETIYGG